MLKYILFSALFSSTLIYASEEDQENIKQVPKTTPILELGISTNPSTINILPGTGELGEFLLKSTDKTPLRIGGVWIADGDVVLTGGAKDQGRWSGNNLAVIGLDLDIEKLGLWKKGSIGVAFLQFNGMNSNEQAGSVQGFDSMTGLPPFNRTELYEIWIRQKFLDDKIAIRVGKTIPTYDFNNILNPVPVQDKTLVIPSVSGLLYTPIFINPVNIGVLPGYYNSAYGVTMNIAPVKNYYLSLGAYDGNLAKGVQTGLTGPHFNGHYFYIAETGVSWLAGEESKPGNIAIGGWAQTGKLSIPHVVDQQGAQGVYLFGSQRAWLRHPKVDDSGISVFWQLGYNHAKTLPMNKFVGFGLTAFALTRPQDSFGLGTAWSSLNQRLFTRKSELMIQAYYQAHLFHTTYLEPVLTYIPTPGGGNHLPQTLAGTVQMITLF